MTVEEGVQLLTKALQDGTASGQEKQHGHDLALSSFLSYRTSYTESERADLWDVLGEAAWWMCNRGILRPGRSKPNANWVMDSCYRLTSFGKEWIKEPVQLEYSLSDRTALSSLVKSHVAQFGTGYQQRALEAVACYHGRNYLACCSMCGAASESVVLALAVAKSDEATVLKEYASARGLSNVRNKILKVEQLDSRLKLPFDAYVQVIKYWRDDASHGKATPIDEEHATVAMLTLLRLIQFASDNWSALTT